MASVLITGGAGFIGSHTCVVLLEAGHELLVLDDSPTAPQWLLRGRSCSEEAPFVAFAETSAILRASTQSLQTHRQLKRRSKP